MADGFSATPGSGATIATDDVGGVHYQRVKIDLGADGAASPLVRGQQGDAASLPVALSTEQAALLAALAGIVSAARAAVNLIAGEVGVAAGAGPVSAATLRTTLADDDPAVTGLAAILVALGDVATGADITALAAALETVSVTGPLTNDQLRDSPVAVSDAAVAEIAGGDYEPVPAGTSRAFGATGDYLAGLLAIPASTSPGSIEISDGSTTMTVFAGGDGSVGSLVPFPIPLGARSLNGPWTVHAGADISVLALGDFI